MPTKTSVVHGLGNIKYSRARSSKEPYEFVIPAHFTMPGIVTSPEKGQKMDS